MMIQGYGAGASVTAAGVFADIMSILLFRLMKHIIILGDGMADWPAESLGNKTLLQYAAYTLYG